MFTPTVVLLLASYAGPAAPPDANLRNGPTLREERRIDRSREEYVYPENRGARERPLRREGTPNLDRAGEGRMVVPRKFR